MAIDQGVTEGEGLGQTDQGAVKGGVAVGVIFTHDVADDAGAFLVGFVREHAHFVHAVDDAALNGLEAIADVRNGAAHDDRHRVIEEGGANFGRDIAVDEARDDAADGGFVAEHRIFGLGAFAGSDDGASFGLGSGFFFAIGFFVDNDVFLFFVRHIRSPFSIRCRGS